RSPKLRSSKYGMRPTCRIKEFITSENPSKYICLSSIRRTKSRPKFSLFEETILETVFKISKWPLKFSSISLISLIICLTFILIAKPLIYYLVFLQENLCFSTEQEKDKSICFLAIVCYKNFDSLQLSRLQRQLCS